MKVLTPEKVTKILTQCNHLTTRKAGELMGVSRTTISNIRNNKAWPEVTNPFFAKKEKI
jgi:DNA-binding XRE family transcriptional regulator